MTSYTMKPHTIAGTLMLPDAEEKLTSMPVSDNTVKLRIYTLMNDSRTPQTMLSKWTSAVRTEMPML